MNVFNDRVRSWFDGSAVCNIRRIPLLMLLGFFLCVASCKAWGDEAPLEVDVIDQPLFGTNFTYKYLRITALADAIHVKNVIVNRGKCDFYNGPYKERKMEYGDKMELTVSCSRVLEVEAQTDQGNWKFTFR